MTAPSRSWHGAIGSPVEAMNHGTPPTPVFTWTLSPTEGRQCENTCSRAGTWS
ncbi:hypothetical protein [Actinomadura macra]|uniref:hypothetical protein n=1 Tax=Actinomadura macra TaxID=46164 RepID=UPI0012FB37A0|nr:hypothetical protein [Actinomadura macra]